eukprot:scaffold234037_cov17-Tisochrysis_lutea.AAC.1
MLLCTALMILCSVRRTMLLKTAQSADAQNNALKACGQQISHEAGLSSMYENAICFIIHCKKVETYGTHIIYT